MGVQREPPRNAVREMRGDGGRPGAREDARMPDGRRIDRTGDARAGLRSDGATQARGDLEVGETLPPGGAQAGTRWKHLGLFRLIGQFQLHPAVSGLPGCVRGRSLAPAEIHAKPIAGPAHVPTTSTQGTSGVVVGSVCLENGSRRCHGVASGPTMPALRLQSAICRGVRLAGGTGEGLGDPTAVRIARRL